MKAPRRGMCAFFAAALSSGAGAGEQAIAFDHADWSEVLERRVDAAGRVDYAGLAGDRAALDRYLAALAAVSPDSAPERFARRDDELAYWLNAYNALVVDAVLERGVDTPSVWGDGLFGIGFFTVERGPLGGRRISLKRLEDEIVRDRYRDPRVHAALNCASVGCPRLPRRAFDGATLDRELDAAMGEFVADPRHVRLDLGARSVWLSKIFDWFAGDFVAFEQAQGVPAPSVVDYVNRYRSPSEQIPARLRVRHLDYDKRLNRAR